MEAAAALYYYQVHDGNERRVNWFITFCIVVMGSLQ